jgi:adenosine deaminase
MANEYLLAHSQQGFNRDELRRLAAHSIHASFLPESEKERLLVGCGRRL